MTGRQVFAIFIAAFAVVGAVNIGMAWLAISTFSGEVDHAPPPGGLNMIQNPEGFAATGIEIAREGDRLRIALADAARFELIDAELSRPATNAEDRPLLLSRTAAGRYDADLDGVPRGQWEVVVKLRDSTTGRALFHRTRILLP